MKYVLDALKMKTKTEAHVYLKEMLALPEYYGGNLDALYDCLSECDDIEIEIQNMPEGKTYVSKIINVMKDADIKIEVI